MSIPEAYAALAQHEGTRVTVHFNLHRNLWSVKVPGQPMLNVPAVALEDATPVALAGKWRQSQELGRRKVYLQVRGTLRLPIGQGGDQEVRHNPAYGAPEFRTLDGQRWEGSSSVLFPASSSDRTLGAGYALAR